MKIKDLYKSFISYFLLFSMIALIVCGVMSYVQYNRLSNTYLNLIESYQTIRAANQTIISLDGAALSVGSFIYKNDATSLTKLPELIIAAEVNFAALKQLVSDNKTQTDLANQATPLFDSKIIILTKITKEYKSGQTSQAMLIAEEGSKLHLTTQINTYIQAIKQEEVKQLNQHAKNLVKFKTQINSFIPMLGILSALFFICFLFLLDKYLKRY